MQTFEPGYEDVADVAQAEILLWNNVLLWEKVLLLYIF